MGIHTMAMLLTMCMAALQEDKVAVLVGTVTDDVRLYEVPALTVVALRVTETRARAHPRGAPLHLSVFAIYPCAACKRHAGLCCSALFGNCAGMWRDCRCSAFLASLMPSLPNASMLLSLLGSAEWRRRSL